MADDPVQQEARGDPGPGSRGQGSDLATVLGAVLTEDTRELMEVKPKTRNRSPSPS